MWFVWSVSLALLDIWIALNIGFLHAGLFFTAETKSPGALVLLSTSPHAVCGLMNTVLIGLLFVYCCCHSAGTIQ